MDEEEPEVSDGWVSSATGPSLGATFDKISFQQQGWRAQESEAFFFMVGSPPGGDVQEFEEGIGRHWAGSTKTDRIREQPMKTVPDRNNSGSAVPTLPLNHVDSFRLDLALRMAHLLTDAV